LTKLLVVDASVAVAACHTPAAAWKVADELGWAKTYDAHYVALAQLLKCRLVTVDERMLRGVARLKIAVRPREL
jgi:predicted nucleic acid-binding protein